ncbi:MAG: MBL fold metallo-hydrolase [Firmicutes bacterium]|nr:MBL fold metallo-hydrolase [Bacillota bacterium]
MDTYGDARYYITQYNDATGSQAMFYTIESNKGALIIIDGGWSGNAEQVRSVLKEKGNHVDAWILTHPHPDHIGSFNQIYSAPGDITIDAIYAIEMDYDKYKAKAQPWDEFEVYENFLALTADEDRLYYVRSGDEFEVCGLSFFILHTYESWVDEMSPDLANDGSMMFKVTNQEESMLFCADVGIRVSDRIEEQWGDMLDCDYIQMGHHGNGGLSESFYRLTEPKAAFFDAPEWLMNPESNENGWTTPQNREIMESMEAQIYYYYTAPNRIELK